MLLHALQAAHRHGPQCAKPLDHFAHIAQQVRRFVVAGGETSGSVVNALGVQLLKIGDTIDPGVPWTSGQVGKPLLDAPAPVLLALKSGNFGTEDFFAKALAMKNAR